MPDSPSPPILLQHEWARIANRGGNISPDPLDNPTTSAETTPHGPTRHRNAGDSSANLIRRLRVNSPSPEVDRGDMESANNSDLSSNSCRLRFGEINSMSSPEYLHHPVDSPSPSGPALDVERRRNLEAYRTRLVLDIERYEEQQANLIALRDTQPAFLPLSLDEYNAGLLASTDFAAMIWNRWQEMDEGWDGDNI